MSEELETKVEQLSREAAHTARVIADADARAADANAAMFEAMRERQAAEERSSAAEARVTEAVALRLRAMGADRAQWPEVARKGVEDAEHEAAAAGARVRDLEGQLEAVRREVEENAAQQARWKVRSALPACMLLTVAGDRSGHESGGHIRRARTCANKMEIQPPERSDSRSACGHGVCEQIMRGGGVMPLQRTGLLFEAHVRNGAWAHKDMHVDSRHRYGK